MSEGYLSTLFSEASAFLECFLKKHSFSCLGLPLPTLEFPSASAGEARHPESAPPFLAGEFHSWPPSSTSSI